MFLNSPQNVCEMSTCTHLRQVHIGYSFTTWKEHFYFACDWPKMNILNLFRSFSTFYSKKCSFSREASRKANNCNIQKTYTTEWQFKWSLSCVMCGQERSMKEVRQTSCLKRQWRKTKILQSQTTNCSIVRIIYK